LWFIATLDSTNCYLSVTAILPAKR
jgi:hypothetical protein